MKRINLLPMLVLLCSILTACGDNISEEAARKTVIAMDTAITLTAYGKNSGIALAEAENEIYRLDTKMSRSNENGEIYTLNTNKNAEASDETAFVINTALDISKSTNGAFDITVAPIMDLWGFFGHSYRVPSEAELKEQLIKVNYKNIELKDNIVSLKDNSTLDLGGIAKGYASDRVKEIFNKYNIEAGLISFGSAIQAIGTKPDGSKWRIGITDPQNKDSHIARLDISDKCIATSGSYEQVFEENGQIYHHIINPSTGYPANSGLAAVSVISGNAAIADALSTALFVMGLDDAIDCWKSRNDFEMILITDDNTVYYTAALENSIEILKDTKYNKIKLQQ
ncbi:MAG: FAD:protein FMN transferase [bacterium]|nr:FAD:protein FMN transferase [bacterium]